jgi:hypothetical protein
MHQHWKSEQYNELTLMTLLGVSLLRIKLDNPRVRQDNDFYKRRNKFKGARGEV